MVKILLLGDSIRGGYQHKVQEKLGENYKVFAPNDNCRFSAYTLNSVRFWLGLQALPEVKEFMTEPDIIHWNNGLWDVARLFGENRCFCSLDEYLSNMERTYNFLRKNTKAKIILATTTPTRKEKELDPMVSHFVADIERYNKALIERLGDKVDCVNDLFSLVMSEREKIIREDDLIHLTDYGKEVCSNAVVQSIFKVEKL